MQNTTQKTEQKDVIIENAATQPLVWEHNTGRRCESEEVCRYAPFRTVDPQNKDQFVIKEIRIAERGLEGLFRTLGPIHVTDDFKLSSPVQNFTFYTPNLPCHQGLWRRIHQAVRTMPLLDQLIEICGPNPTPLTLLELGMVTLGASTLPTTIIAIEKIRAGIGSFTGPADLLLAGAAYLAMLIDHKDAIEQPPEDFPSFFTQSQDTTGIIRANHGDLSFFLSNRLNWLPKALVKVHAGSTESERLELRNFVAAFQKQPLYTNNRIQSQFQQLLSSVLEKVNNSLENNKTCTD